MKHPAARSRIPHFLRWGGRAGNVEKRNYLFIPGMSRSGTSWVAHWLAERRDLVAVHETYLIRYAFDMLHHQPAAGRLVSRERARSFLHQAYADHAGGCPWLLDKSPGEFLYDGVPVHDVIRELFPEAFILWLYRDGKDFVYGLLHLPWKARTAWNARTATDYWIRETRPLLEVQPHPRMMIMRYEDLLAAPRRSRQISEFLGLGHHADIRPWAKPVNTRYQAYEAGRWKSLDAESLEEMKRMNPLLVQCGYDPV